MNWISNFQLFLFDFDGLLVNTEELHYQAYLRMCAKRGHPLPWDFNRYCQAAHYHSETLRKEILEVCPGLKEQEPDWQVLYKEKQEEIKLLLKEGAVSLMPGVPEMLKVLQEKSIKRAVVTNSSDELISIIREQHPILDTIPYWITRHHYAQPKPDPECYIKAITQLASPKDLVIGFEDTPRGLTALMGTSAKAVLVCGASYPEIPSFKEKGALHFTSFKDLIKNFHQE